MKLSSLLIIGMIIAGNAAVGQVKFEREYRLDPAEVPHAALSFVEAIEVKKKVKWYKELSQDGRTVEAKFKFKGRKYSVEFDTAGVIEDVEYIIQANDIRDDVRERIEDDLDGRFDAWKFEKIQRQYVGNRSQLLKLFFDDEGINVPVFFEIVVKGRVEADLRSMEITYTSEGALYSEATIIQPRNDHLEY